jgi:hypothetical protein
LRAKLDPILLIYLTLPGLFVECFVASSVYQRRVFLGLSFFGIFKSGKSIFLLGFAKASGERDLWAIALVIEEKGKNGW